MKNGLVVNGINGLYLFSKAKRRGKVRKTVRLKIG